MGFLFKQPKTQTYTAPQTSQALTKDSSRLAALQKQRLMQQQYGSMQTNKNSIDSSGKIGMSTTGTSGNSNI